MKKNAILPALLAGAAVLVLPSPGLAGFEMKGYAVSSAAPQSAPASPAAEAALPGFGSGLPLAIALQQVAPAGYQFSFGGGVDPGAPVSWTGGKPWRQVLADMLAAQKLAYSLQNNVIVVDRAGAESPVAAPAAAPVPVAVPLPVLAEAEPALFEEEILDEKAGKPAPMVTRRNGRRGAVSTRRDFGVEGRRSLFARLSDKFSFKRKETPKAGEAQAAPKPKTAPEAIQWGAASAEAPPALAAGKPAPVEAVALAPGAAADAIQWQDATAEKTPFADSEVVSGFGTDMPLAIALQQVVPAGYDVSYSGEVNRNLTVSWEGGKPWRQALADMLAAQKLGFRVEGKTVVLSGLADTAPPKEQWLPPVSLTREETVTTPPSAPVPASSPAPASAPEKAAEALPAKQLEEKPAEASRDAIVSRRDSIAGRRAATGDSRSWLERFRDRFGFTKKEQPQSQPQPETESKASSPVAAETAEMKAPEEKAPIALTSRRGRQAEIPAAQEVAPPPAAVPLALSAKPAAETPPQQPLWLAPKDKTLRDVLADWSKKEGVELYWSTDYDYRLTGNAAYSGNFDEAVAKLLGDFVEIRPQPYGELHQALDGARVLVINTYTTHN